MPFIIDAAVLSNCGKIRDSNEDNFVFNKKCLPEDNLGMSKPYGKTFTVNAKFTLGVFDGMGGEQYGQTASYAAANMLSEKSDSCMDEAMLEKLCFEMNNVVVETAKAKHVQRCGTTCAIISFSNQIAYFCNVGDSKIIHIRTHSATQISVDHLSPSIINGISIKRKPTLTQYIGVDPEEFIIEPFCGEKEMTDGDIFLLCSDGLSDSVSLNDMADATYKFSNSKDLVEYLVGLALERDGRDNITVVICIIKEVCNDQ